MKKHVDNFIDKINLDTVMIKNATKDQMTMHECFMALNGDITDIRVKKNILPYFYFERGNFYDVIIVKCEKA